MKNHYLKKQIFIDIGKYFHGVNNSELETAIGKRQFQNRKFQCVESLNFVLSTNKRRVGTKALASLTGSVEGMTVYKKINGTEYLLVVNEGVIKSINTTTGAETTLYDMSSIGEAWFVNWNDKCFVAAGGVFTKVEGTAAYRVGIAAPSGTVTVSAVAGGSLPDGVYNVYVSYARKITTNVLYSRGYSLGNVTLSGGNNTVRVVCPNSADPQVNNKIIWMTDAGGSTWYFYKQTNNNTTTTIDITSDAYKNVALLYQSLAENNYTPPNFSFIHIHNKVLYGVIDNYVYWTLPEYDVYDLERYNTTSVGRIQKFPFNIFAMFSIGEDLYFNTEGGIFKQPYGDMSLQYVRVGEQDKTYWYFSEPRSIQQYGTNMIGYTNEGFKIFTPDGFLTNNLSKDIHATISKIKSGISSNNKLCGMVYYRQDERSEYHVSYRDTSVSDDNNNRRLVLNLDKLEIASKEDYIVPWEIWSCSFNYSCIQPSNNKAWYLQKHATESILYYEDTDQSIDDSIYSGDTITTATTNVFKAYLRSGQIIPDGTLSGIFRPIQIRTITKFIKEFSIRVQIASHTYADDKVTFVTGDEAFILDQSFLDQDGFYGELPYPQRIAVKKNIKGYSFYIEIEHETNDKDFQIQELNLRGLIVRSRYV